MDKLPKQAYYVIGAVLLAALAVVYALCASSFSLVMRMLFFMVVAAVMLGTYRGVEAANERERQEAERERQAAEAARRAAQEAAFREQMANRTSLGGRTITIRRRKEESKDKADSLG